MDRPIGVVIADDEAPARRKIRALLERDGRFSVLAEARDGDETVAHILEHRPDLVFLDIQMPKKTGFEVIEAIGWQRFPRVIFSTAYDAYALKAFEVNAMDYLLKPYEAERFRRSLERVVAAIEKPEPEDTNLKALLDRMNRSVLRRILVRDGKQMVPVELDQVTHITAEGKYVRLHTAKRSYLHRETLSGLEDKLDPERFVRIHRSTMVQLPMIAGLSPWSHGDYRVQLKDGTVLMLSRTYRENLLAKMGS